MALRSKTLRRMPPNARKVARLIGEMESVIRRLKNMLPRIEELEADSRALKHHSCLKTLEEKGLLPPDRC
jgi:hypothetical protein